MNLLFILILAVVAVTVIAIVRNKGSVEKAWEAIVAFVLALIAAGVHLWGGQS